MLARRAARGAIGRPSREGVGERGCVAGRSRAAASDEQAGITTHRVPRTEGHGRAEGGRLENRMKPGVVKAAANKGDIRQRVEVTQHANAIDENNVALSGRRAESVELQPLVRRPPLDRLEMSGRRLM